MAALDAEHYLQEIGAQQGKDDWLSSDTHLNVQSRVIAKANM